METQPCTLVEVSQISCSMTQDKTDILKPISLVEGGKRGKTGTLDHTSFGRTGI